MLPHGVAAVGRDDADLQVAALALGRHGHQVRVAHRAGVEGGDLVVVAVGGDVALRRVQFTVAVDQLVEVADQHMMR